MTLATVSPIRRGPTIGGIQVDVATKETHRTKVEISESPVETGSKIADHASDLPDELGMEGIFSDLPWTFEAGKPTAQDRYLQVLQLIADREPFEVITGFRVYTNMLFTSFEVDRDSSTGMVIAFRAELKQLMFAGSEVVKANKADSKKAKPTKDAGPKQLTPASKTTEQSVLKKLKGTSNPAKALAGILR